MPKGYFLAALAVFFVMSVVPVTARPDGFDKQEAAAIEGPLRLTSNKDVLIRLDQDAASVVVNNPAHAAVMLDTPRLLIVMPRLPGATSFHVLNAKGEIILKKDVIVSNVEKQYVRIRRACGANDASCQAAAYYYCPDGCYEVTPVPPGDANATPAPPQSGSPVSPALAPAPAMPQDLAPSQAINPTSNEDVIMPVAPENEMPPPQPAPPAQELR